jgi:hypothetical protein
MPGSSTDWRLNAVPRPQVWEKDCSAGGDREILRQGRAWLCVDVNYENVGLRSYYERLGFEMVGEVSGESPHPTGATPDRWRAALYQRLST